MATQKHPLPSVLVTVTKQIKFAAAHHLAHHKGKCRNLHGHSFVLEVSVTGPVAPVDGSSGSGMVADFAAVGAFLKHLHDTMLDHRCLNDVEEYPTAERLALRVLALAWKDLEPKLPRDAWVSGVRLFEEHVFPACFVSVSSPRAHQHSFEEGEACICGEEIPPPRRFPAPAESV